MRVDLMHLLDRALIVPIIVCPSYLGNIESLRAVFRGKSPLSHIWVSKLTHIPILKEDAMVRPLD